MPGRLIFIHLRCWEVLPFSTLQRQRCVKILCPKDPEFYTPLALNCQKRQNLSALELYKVNLMFLRETDFDTPPVLGGAALFDNSAPAVYKIQSP